MAARWNRSTSVDVPRDRSVGVPDPTGQPAQTGSMMSMGGEACGSEGVQRTSVESRNRFDSVRQSLERSRRRFRSRMSGDGLWSRPSTAGESASSSHDHIVLSQICYLLISPLLPPVSHFATMFSKLNDRHDICSRSDAPPSLNNSSSSSSPAPDGLSPPNRNLANHPTLAIYGTQDFFCSHRKLRTWAENLASQPDSLFRFREVENAGHFWQEVGADKELRRRIREWLCDVVLGVQEDYVLPSAQAAIS